MHRRMPAIYQRRREPGLWSCSGMNSSINSSGSNGFSGSATPMLWITVSDHWETSLLKGMRVLLPPRSSSTALMSDPLEETALETLSGSTPRCSPRSRLRNPEMPFSTRALPPASIARSHSVSRPIERLLRFDEPTLTKVSSITSTFAWTLIWSLPSPGMMG